MTVKLMCLSDSVENQRVIEFARSLLSMEFIERPEGVFLIVEDGKLGLADHHWPKVKPVFVDFVSGASAHRRLYGGGAGQAVAKAVGLNKTKELSVLDATAGLGRDGFVMASLGATVTLYERHPAVHAVLADGLRRLALVEELCDISERLALVFRSLLQADTVQSTFDVVYLDPMFPSRDKSAKVKKDMSLFHSLVGADADADDLFKPAYALAKKRLVVKRPKLAPYLAAQKPTLELVGKSSRFDVYTKQSIAS